MIWLVGGGSPKRKTRQWSATGAGSEGPARGFPGGNRDALQPGEIVLLGRDSRLLRVEEGEERIGCVTCQAGQEAKAREASDVVNRETLGDMKRTWRSGREGLPWVWVTLAHSHR